MFGVEEGGVSQTLADVAHIVQQSAKVFNSFSDMRFQSILVYFLSKLLEFQCFQTCFNMFFNAFISILSGLALIMMRTSCALPMTSLQTARVWSEAYLPILSLGRPPGSTCLVCLWLRLSAADRQSFRQFFEISKDFPCEK